MVVKDDRPTLVSGKEIDGGTFQHLGGRRKVGSPKFEQGIALRISRKEPK